MPPELTDLRRWIEKADNDTATAEAAIGLSRPVTDTAAFHCQQAVEKLLKAFLFSRDYAFEKIHDLRALVLQCQQFDPAFGTLMNSVAPLTAFAVRFRYPGSIDPTVRDVRDALEVVYAVRQFVLDRLPPEVR